ncbi:MAG: 30S ribosome-binding factor RbfA [Actinobacteria bacterium]|nr:30S ribosome-binding factor RbfA [Actinomycetota bacterium]
MVREVLADELVRIADVDERLDMVTVTEVEVHGDLRHAVVYLSPPRRNVLEILEEHRGRLQRAVAQEVRLKRTPQLTFNWDPSVIAAAKVERALRRLRRPDPPGSLVPGPPIPFGSNGYDHEPGEPEPPSQAPDSLKTAPGTDCGWGDEQ